MITVFIHFLLLFYALSCSEIGIANFILIHNALTIIHSKNNQNVLSGSHIQRRYNYHHHHLTGSQRQGLNKFVVYKDTVDDDSAVNRAASSDARQLAYYNY